MASAERLLHDAQYAFHSISFGETRDNKRNASRATSLCRKIIRKYPGTMEAGEALAILRRLGEEAYASNIKARHQHITEAQHHRAPVPASQRTFVVDGDVDVESLDWGGLITRIFMLPKAVVGVLLVAGLFLFGIFGPMLLVALVAFVVLTSPFRKMLKPGQRKELDAFVARANAFIAEQQS